MSKRDSSVSAAAINRATGRPWAEWSAILAAFDVRANGHKAAAAHLRAAHDVPPWWSQMLTVKYEQEQGLRQPLQRSDQRFAINVQRTMKASINDAWSAWTRTPTARRWLGSTGRATARIGGRFGDVDGIEFALRTCTPRRLLRFDAKSGSSPNGQLEVQFIPRGATGVTIAVEHSRLPTAAEAKRLKRAWSQALDALTGILMVDAPARKTSASRARAGRPASRNAAPRASKRSATART